jgi:hypothetical protein
LLFEHRRILQSAGCRDRQKLLVRDAAPDEERQPRRELEIADAIGSAASDVGGILLRPIQEPRMHE